MMMATLSIDSRYNCDSDIALMYIGFNKELTIGITQKDRQAQITLDRKQTKQLRDFLNQTLGDE